MTNRVFRYDTADELAHAAARRLLDRLLELQYQQDAVHVCLTGGEIATKVYEAFADLAQDSDLDSGKLHLWWGDESFVETSDPSRHSLHALTLLARTLPLVPSQTHSMPASDGHHDPDEAAYAYAAELGSTVFDICLLGMGRDGHVAAIFPGHPSFEPSSSTVIGVTDAPKPPAERISLSLEAINNSREVWVFVSGPTKADATSRALGGDASLPAAHVSGRDLTSWFVDAEAAALTPTYRCAF